MGVEFTMAECTAMYELIDQLSGGNSESVFAWDGSDDLNNPTISSAVKLFKVVGQKVPEHLGE